MTERLIAFLSGTLEKQVKEREEKMNKLKQVAIKAKKEMESVKKRVCKPFTIPVFLS